MTEYDSSSLDKTNDTEHLAKVSTFALSFCVIIFFLALALYFYSSESDFGTGKRTFDSVGGNFTLYDANGPVSLSDFNGEVVVLYFGFTQCQLVCPTSMTTMSTAFNRLTDSAQQRTRGILITLDPETDSPQVLQTFTQKFHDRIVGLWGSPTKIDKVIEQYAVFSDPDSDMSEIRHTSRYYIIDTSGNVVDVMRHSTTVNELKTRIEMLL